MCSVDYSDGFWVYRRDWVSSRKARRCLSCSASISPGVPYARIAWAGEDSEGTVYLSRACSACDAATTEFCDAHGGIQFPPENLEERLDECIDENHENDEESPRWLLLMSELRARRAKEFADAK